MDRFSDFTGTSGALYTCSLCGHRWVSRKDDGIPKSCPKCRSTVWMKDYLRCVCLRCGHKWGTARGRPKRCPRCHSVRWDIPDTDVHVSGGSSLSRKEKDDIAGLYEGGMGCTEISIETGIPFSDVYAALRMKFPGAIIRI